MSTFINLPQCPLKCDLPPIAALQGGYSAQRLVESNPQPRAGQDSGLENSRFRRAKLAAVKAQIAAGTYETAERIRVTVERLLHSLS